MACTGFKGAGLVIGTVWTFGALTTALSGLILT